MRNKSVQRALYTLRQGEVSLCQLFKRLAVLEHHFAGGRNQLLLGLLIGKLLAYDLSVPLLNVQNPLCQPVLPILLHICVNYIIAQINIQLCSGSLNHMRDLMRRGAKDRGFGECVYTRHACIHGNVDRVCLRVVITVFGRNRAVLVNSAIDIHIHARNLGKRFQILHGSLLLAAELRLIYSFIHRKRAGFDFALFKEFFVYFRIFFLRPAVLLFSDPLPYFLHSVMNSLFRFGFDLVDRLIILCGGVVDLRLRTYRHALQIGISAYLFKRNALHPRLIQFGKRRIKIPLPLLCFQSGIVIGIGLRAGVAHCAGVKAQACA